MVIRIFFRTESGFDRATSWLTPESISLHFRFWKTGGTVFPSRVSVRVSSVRDTSDSQCESSRLR